MKLSQSFYWIFILIIPIQLFAQRDTLKLGFGINSLQFGIAQPTDVYDYYGKGHCHWKHSKNPRYKKLKVKGITFLFAKYDSLLLLELIKIDPNQNKFYIKEALTFSHKTRVKDLSTDFDSIRVLHLSKPNSVLRKYVILGIGDFLFYLLPQKKDLKETGSYMLEEDVLKRYANSKIHYLTFHCKDCYFPPYPVVKKSEQDLQLFYSRRKHYGSYKDRDSVLHISVNHGCLECSHPPFFNVFFYTKKKRIRTIYLFPGFLPFINEEDKPSKTLRQLKKGALQKVECLYFGKHTYTIQWKRKNIRAPYYISKIKHEVL
jgi:hypothetical protein